QIRDISSGSNSTSSARVFSTNKEHSVSTSMLIPNRTQQCKRIVLFKTTQMIKEEEAEAECQKKFCALPAPSHVMQPIYQEMMEMREKESKQGREQRKNFLLSIQKPFSFQEREREKREKLIAKLNQVSEDQKNKAAIVRKPSPQSRKGAAEVCRKVSTQTMVRQENPTASGSPKLRTAERTRTAKLGFLDEKLSFHPKIIQNVPDFSRLHKALQTEVLRKTQIKDVTKCQPFCLRTSALPASTRHTVLKSKSLGALSSLSTDTLPTYITDAERKRCMAIRKSMEIRDSKNQESSDWLRKYQMRSQAMKKTVVLHAKLLDPHSSLNEVYNEKLQQHREADQQRTREYMKELQEMKTRVSERPYLFQQVKQAHAEQIYRNKLKKAGLKEQFVEENGKAVEGVSSSTSFRSGDDGGSTENDTHNRYAL
uniref:FAM161 centrosomal protein B n=1 Tax=Anabas testudineus TaxID=64144 RepID=A0AAQ6INF8_ANATE